MKLRLPLLASALALVALMAVTPTAFAASSAPTRSVTNTLSGTTTSGATLTGTLTNIVFSNVNGVLTMTGTLTGTLTTASGDVTNFTQQITAAVTSANGSCTILHLVLGPLDLNLLGLMVHLNQVVLDITAQPGPGNLLGNLLCAVAHLLDNSNASVTALATLLNNLLGSL